MSLLETVFFAASTFEVMNETLRFHANGSVILPWGDMLEKSFAVPCLPLLRHPCCACGRNGDETVFVMRSKFVLVMKYEQIFLNVLSPTVQSRCEMMLDIV